MTVLHTFRRTAAALAACALLALGLVTLAVSQSQPARAASVGEFTMTPGSGSLTDTQPIAGSVTIPGKCSDVEPEEGFNWFSVLNLYVVKADGTEATVLRGITDNAPYLSATSTFSLASADNAGLEVRSLADAITGDGTYELRLRCVDTISWAVAPDEYVPGDPYWSQKITVTGDNWVVGEGATATSVSVDSATRDVEPAAEVALTATVSPAEATGKVTFLEGTTTLGEATVAGGKTEFRTSTLTQGRHDITARFTPGSAAQWGASESEAITVLVYPADYELRDAADKRLAQEPELERGQKVKLIVRGCTAGTAYKLTMTGNEAAFPAATADTNGVATWSSLTVPDDAVAGRSFWTFTADGKNCKVNGGTGADFTTASFTLGEPESTDDPTDDPTDEPTDEPTDDPTDEPTDGTSGGDTSGTTSGTGGDSGSGSGSGGTSTAGGGLASTGSEIALVSGIGAIVLCAAGVMFFRYGRRSGLLTFGEPRV